MYVDVAAPAVVALALGGGRVLEILPNLIAAFVILAVGILCAWGAGALAHYLLRTAGVDRLLARNDLEPHLGFSASQIGGAVVFGVGTLCAFLVAADVLGLPAIGRGVVRVIEYVPNVVAALAIVVAGWLLGQGAYRRLLADVSLGGAHLARAAIYATAAAMALVELRIAVPVVTIAFAILVGGAVLGAVLAFGLGNRELAGRVTRDWVDRNAMRAPRPEPPQPPDMPEPPRH